MGHGEGGIRTPGTVSSTVVFKTTALNHSATSPITTYDYLTRPTLFQFYLFISLPLHLLISSPPKCYKSPAFYAINKHMDQILGWTATALFTICYIPQMIKTYRTRTIDGLSFRLLLISFIANIVALCYATLIKQPPLQIKYALALFFVGGCIYLYLSVYFNKK